MNKVIVTMIAIIVILSAIITAFAIIDQNNHNSSQIEGTQVAEEILDDCTEEYEQMQQETIKANSEQEKTSPNCALIIKTFFTECGHTTTEYLTLPEEFVNLNEEEIQEKYPDYSIEKFTSGEIILYQSKEGECGEHYLVKDNQGIVTIYKILADESLEEQEQTSISTEYLPETDKMNMENGIRVNGKQDLNQLIEDFE